MKLRYILSTACAAVLCQLAPTAQADVGVPPVVGLSWTPSHTTPGGIVQIRLDVGNPGTSAALTGVAFDVTLPAGVSVNNIGNTPIGCGVVSAVAPSTIHYSNATIPANTPSSNSICNVEINVTTSVEGLFTANTTAPTSNEGGTGTATSATLSVGSAPSITAAFGTATALIGDTVSLTYTLANANSSVAASGVAFTNSLPAGLLLSTPNGLSNSCGGTVTATAGTGSVQLSGASLAAGASCSVVVNVSPTTSGTKNNSVQVSSSNLGNGNTSNSSLTVYAPPSIALAFGAASASLGQNVSLSYTLTNPNASRSGTGVGFNNTLPAGLVVASPNGVSSTCGGTLTAPAGSTSVQLAGASLNTSASCTVSLNVAPTSPGTKTNSVQITSSNLGTGNTANASLTVLGPLEVGLAFGAGNTTVGQRVSLTYTLSNPNASTAGSGVSFNNTLPSGLQVATPNGLTNTCAGSVTAAAGSNSVQLSGGSVPASGSCTVVVNLTPTSAGTMNNSVLVSSTNLGDSNAATASLTATAIASVPTLSEMTMAVLTALLALIAWPWLRSRRQD